MILKSFFRKKSTKIYIAIIIVLFSLLAALNMINAYLKNIMYERYLETVFVLVESENDYEEFLNNYNKIFNVDKVLLGNYSSTTINEHFINISVLNNRVLIYKQDNLDSTSVILGLEDIDYSISSGNFNSAKNGFAKISIGNETYELKINNVINSGVKSILKIASSLFDEIYENTDYYYYLFNIKNENDENEVLEYLNKNIDGEVTYLDFEVPQDIEVYEDMEEYILSLEIATYVLVFIFLIVLLVINKNIIADLKKNIDLEYCLGYKKRQIKNNLFKRLVLFHSLGFIVSIVLSIIITLIIDMFINIKVPYSYLILILVIWLLVLLIDFILSFRTKLSYKIGRRRLV